MAVNAQDLLIQPFKDVIALAVTAAANATASADDETEHGVKVEQMLQSSKSLAREGERALRKVQAVWQSQMVIHGDAFGDRMLKQGVPSSCLKTTHRVLTNGIRLHRKPKAAS